MSSGSGDEGAGGSEGRLTRTRVAKRAQTAGKGSGDGAAAAGEAGGGRQLRRSGRGVKAETEVRGWSGSAVYGTGHLGLKLKLLCAFCFSSWWCELPRQGISHPLTLWLFLSFAG